MDKEFNILPFIRLESIEFSKLLKNYKIKSWRNIEINNFPISVFDIEINFQHFHVDIKLNNNCF